MDEKMTATASNGRPLVRRKVRSKLRSWQIVKQPVSITISSILIAVSVLLIVALMWHRLTWGFQEWIHQTNFFNFWHGTYVVISASILLLINCSLNIWAIRKTSIGGLAVCTVFHGVTMVLLVVGSVALMSDAFTVRQEWIGRMLLDMINPSNYNFNSAKDHFLNRLYKTVECCGANGHQDYGKLHLTPPEGCVNRRFAGSLYFESGCAKKFSVWLKAWAGVVTGVALIIFICEVILMTWSYQLIKILHHSDEAQKSSLKQKATKTAARFNQDRDLPPIPVAHSAALTRTVSDPAIKILEDDSVSLIKTKSFNVLLIGDSEGNTRIMSRRNSPATFQPKANFAANVPSIMARINHPNDYEMEPMLPQRSSSLRKYRKSRVVKEQLPAQAKPVPSPMSQPKFEHQYEVISESPVKKPSPRTTKKLIKSTMETVPTQKVPSEWRENETLMVAQILRAAASKSPPELRDSRVLMTEDQFAAPIPRITASKAPSDWRDSRVLMTEDQFAAPMPKISTSKAPSDRRDSKVMMNGKKPVAPKTPPIPDSKTAAARRVPTNPPDLSDLSFLKVYQLPDSPSLARKRLSQPDFLADGPSQMSTIPYGYENVLPSTKKQPSENMLIYSMISDETDLTVSSSDTETDSDVSAEHRAAVPAAQTRKSSRTKVRSFSERDDDQQQIPLMTQQHRQPRHPPNFRALFETRF